MKRYDLIIIGGGSAGLSAGIYAGRAKLNTLIVEQKRTGGQVNITSEIVNYPGIRQVSGPELMADMYEHALDFGVQFATDEIQKVELEGQVKKLYGKSGKVYEAYAVIIATGASPRKLGFKGEAEFTGRGVAYCATCDGEFFEGLEVFVVGAGFAAAEEAIFLTKFAKKVTIIARESEFTCAKTIADKVFAHPKIEVKFNTEVVEISGEEMLQKATFINNLSGETFDYVASREDGSFGMFIFVGYAPATQIFKGQIELDSAGYIKTNEKLQTTMEGVYAAGDLRPKQLRQIVTAVADGAIAATEAEKYVAFIKETLGIVEPVKTIDKRAVAKKAVAEENNSEFLSAAIKEQLKGIFMKLTKKLTLVSIIDPNEAKCMEMKAFVESIQALSPFIETAFYMKGENQQMEAQIKVDKYPVVAFLDENKTYTGVKFHGIPGGHELNSFVLAIYNLVGPGQALEASVIEKAEAIKEETNLKVCISLACHLCPDVVVAAQRIAMLNSKVEAEMIDLALFPELKKQYKIMSVPAIIYNDEKIQFGAKKINEILEQIQ